VPRKQTEDHHAHGPDQSLSGNKFSEATMLRLPIRSTTHTQLLDHAVPKTHCTYKVYRPSFLTTGLQGSRRRFSWDLPGKEFKELRAIKDFNAQPLLIDGFISLDAALPVVVGALLT
jgi:hypothetical protein